MNGRSVGTLNLHNCLLPIWRSGEKNGEFPGPFCTEPVEKNFKILLVVFFLNCFLVVQNNCLSQCTTCNPFPSQCHCISGYKFLGDIGTVAQVWETFPEGGKGKSMSDPNGEPG
jgi:hypothetical protein